MFTQDFKTFMNDKKQLWLVFLIILLGFLLRIYRIEHQSVWFDEAFSLTVSRQSLSEMTDQLIRDFVHPPLHYYLLHVWFNLVGFGAWQARILSALFGTLSIAMIYLFAKDLFNQQTAILSALLLTVSQLGVLYSQEARPYAQLLFFVLSSSYLFFVALRKGNALAWWGFVISSTLMIYTHYYGVLVVFSLLSYTVFYRKRYPIPHVWLICGTILFVVFYSPWIAISNVIGQALHSERTLPTALPPWFAASWLSPVKAINQFNNGRFFGIVAGSTPWILCAGGLLFTLPALRALKPLWNIFRVDVAECPNQESLVLLSILWLVPMCLVIVLGISMNVPYDVHYIAFCAAPYYILVAHGISKLDAFAVRPIVVIAVLIYSVVALRSNYFIPYKENYRDALAYVANHYREGDYCVFLPFQQIPLQWFIYHGNHPELKVAELDTVVSSPKHYNRIWLVTYHRVSWATRRSEEGERKLEATHSLEEEKQYFWVNVALYVPKK